MPDRSSQELLDRVHMSLERAARDLEELNNRACHEAGADPDRMMECASACIHYRHAMGHVQQAMGHTINAVGHQDDPDNIRVNFGGK